jgi:hypothetical protein
MSARRAAAALAALIALAPTCAAADPPPDEARTVFAISDADITESSGLAASQLHRGVLYTHNDSGGEPVIYAVGSDGRTAARLTLAGAGNRDWEAIAPGRDAAGRPVLWVGDIGDNLGVWRSIGVYQVREPARLRSQEVAWTRYRLRYADGPRDAEALLADPRTGRLYVVSKEASGAGVYAAPATLRTDSVNVLRRVADAPARVTDGAYLPDGAYAVLRGYFSAVVVDRRWQPVASVDLPLQQQGESLAPAADGGSVLVGSEGPNSPVWKVPLPALRRSPPAQRSSADVSAAAGSSEGPPGSVAAHTTAVAVILGLALIGSLIGLRRSRSSGAGATDAGRGSRE